MAEADGSYNVRENQTNSLEALRSRLAGETTQKYMVTYSKFGVSRFLYARGVLPQSVYNLFKADEPGLFRHYYFGMQLSSNLWVWVSRKEDVCEVYFSEDGPGEEEVIVLEIQKRVMAVCVIPALKDRVVDTPFTFVGLPPNNCKATAEALAEAQPTGKVFAEEFAVGMAIPKVFEEDVSSVEENDKLGESVDCAVVCGKVSPGEGSAVGDRPKTPQKLVDAAVALLPYLHETTGELVTAATLAAHLTTEGYPLSKVGKGAKALQFLMQALRSQEKAAAAAHLVKQTTAPSPAKPSPARLNGDSPNLSAKKKQRKRALVSPSRPLASHW